MRTCDVEFAHCEIEPADRALQRDEVVISGEIAARLVELLRARDVEVTTSVLIDDKRSVDLDIDTPVYLEDLRGIVGGLVVGRLLRESALVAFVDDLVSKIDLEHRDRVRKEIDEYAAVNNGLIGCSHDISIWHSLRLGLIRTQPRWLLAPSSQPHGARVCVSILPSRYRTFEDRARKRILNHIPGFENRRLHVLYFGARQFGPVTDGMVSTFADRISCVVDKFGAGPYGSAE